MRKRVVSLILLLLLLSIGAYAHSETSKSDAVPRSTLSVIPLYTGENHVILQDDQPDFYSWQITTEAYVSFSQLDALGRTGPAMACLAPETLPTRPRGQIGNVRPSGWHTTRYDDLIDDKYLYNRAHVIGFSLCGDNATPENLFTGTRYLNAVSMLSYEVRVLNYIVKTGNHVLYRCSPVYDGNDLVATGVQMEAWSVEDEGTLCFNVFLFNVQPGIVIDYATGESERAEAAEEVASAADRGLGGGEGEVKTPAVTYVLNTNTHKFHRPSCPSVEEIKRKNRKDFYGTRGEVIAAGYDPCGRCHP